MLQLSRRVADDCCYMRYITEYRLKIQCTRRYLKYVYDTVTMMCTFRVYMRQFDCGDIKYVDSLFPR